MNIDEGANGPEINQNNSSAGSRNRENGSSQGTENLLLANNPNEPPNEEVNPGTAT
jgi:hypothetical protein